MPITASDSKMISKRIDTVSVIMPAYNCERYVSDAISSVIRQTYHTWELIIVDDCSNDGTYEICKSISEKDARIRLIRNNENKGVSFSRNRGISESKGNWIAFLDSDDLWDDRKLEKQIGLIEKEECSFAFTGSRFIGEDNKFYNGIFRVPKVVSYKQLRKANVISCSSVLICKELLKNIKMENDDMSEDYAVWLKVLKKGNIACGLDEPLLIYRISKTSKSGDKSKAIIMAYRVHRYLGTSCLLSLFLFVYSCLQSIFEI